MSDVLDICISHLFKCGQAKKDEKSGGDKGKGIGEKNEVCLISCMHVIVTHSGNI
jgi:hypothetical protein